MALVFKTEESYPESVTFMGVGLVPGNGKGGILVDEAAEGMTQLQSEGGAPLSGKELKDAAQALADSVPGLTVANAPKDATRASLALEAGLIPEPPPADVVARERYLRTYGHLDPEVVKDSLPEGTPAPEGLLVNPNISGDTMDQPRPDIGPLLGEGADAPTTSAADDSAPASAAESTKSTPKKAGD